ncbi:MAG TPA: hypothetical protein VJ992_13825 [Gemmatimonadales bacterium]|nr:hypothetical protein [Gemmatimonadales bacterium]
MTAPSERRPLGRLLLATIAFALVAPPGLDSPIGLAAIPLAMLVLVATPRPRTLVMAGLISAVVGILWLASGSGLPAQTASATALIGGVTFAATSATSRSSFAHRALLTSAMTAVLVAALFAAQGISWHELHWYVARNIELPLREEVNAMNALFETVFKNTSQDAIRAAEPRVRLTIAVMAAAFPAALALVLVAGCGLAALIADRVAPGTAGLAPGRFRDFRFSEHLGWLAVVPAAVLIVRYAHGTHSALSILEQADGLFALAVNGLLLVAALYALRGLAVMTFALGRRGSAAISIAWWGSLVILAIVSLLAAFFGAIVLGLLDSVLDLRRRWLTPPPVGA